MQSRAHSARPRQDRSDGGGQPSQPDQADRHKGKIAPRAGRERSDRGGPQIYAGGFGGSGRAGVNQSVNEPIKAIARITNKRGLHARASAKIVEAAARFQSEITIVKDGTRVNARSIMGLMMLAASLGSEIGVEAEGPDAPEAM